MTSPNGTRHIAGDPLLAAIDMGYPITLDVLDRAIAFRQFLIEQVQEEIASLQRCQARLYDVSEQMAGRLNTLREERDRPLGNRS